MRTRRGGWWLALVWVVTALPPRAHAETPGSAEFFEKAIRPLLADRCQKCHSGAEPKGGLDLTSRAGLLAGGDSGPAAVEGKPDESLIVAAVRYEDDPKMPPKGKLDDPQVEALTRWVAIGLPWPDAAPAPVGLATKGRPYQINDEQRRFWSFQPVREVEPPAVQETSWPKSEIDRFILSRLEARGLRPAAPADKRTLIRRATFDLIGLPPTPEEIDAFLADESPQAFARVVDRLLTSSQYGERWGRHWLDVVRYADSRDARGIGGDADIGEAYRYRDWVVNAFNRDLPYDRFIVEQVAGDIEATRGGGFRAEGLVATGLLTLGEWGAGDADKEKMMSDIVADQIDVVGRSLLGLTIACARCHDHKFDPIPTADYYGLAGIFFSTHIIPGPGDKTAGSPMLRTPILPPVEVAEIARSKARVVALDREIAEVAEAGRSAFARGLVPETARYLLAAWDYQAESASGSRPTLATFADDRGLHAHALRQWIDYLGLGEGRLMDRAERDVSGKAGVYAWRGSADCPVLMVNTTGEEVAFSTLKIPPRSVTMHPGPASAVVAAWTSPIAGRFRVAGRLIDADPNGGDGVTWTLTQRRAGVSTLLASGDLANGGSQGLDQGQGADRLNAVAVQAGDQIQLAILPRAEYSYDTTNVEFTIARHDGSAAWDLAGDLLPNPIQEGKGNPHADSQGRPAVWRFVEVEQARTARSAVADPASALARWDRAVQAAQTGQGDRAAIEEAAQAVQHALESSSAGPDAPLIADLNSSRSPFLIQAAEDDRLLPEPTRSKLAELRAERAVQKARVDTRVPVALAAQEGGVPKSPHGGVHDARIHIRGDYQRLGELVPRHVPQIVAGPNPPTITSGSGRRELAYWIASPENPLTARVMVNRIWEYHFGEGIVRTPSNFGKLGEPPTDPELLDYLARRFVASGWSIKAMHRAIMLSATYQESSAPTPETLKQDPENRLFGRMNRRRLEAEAIRDALLSVSGRLDSTRGGPAIRDLANNRRTLYLMTIRSDRSSFGPLFDAADPAVVVDKRTVSTVAPQALFLLNDPFVLEQARALADRVLGENLPDDPARIRRLYALLYGRPPDDDEIEIGRSALAGLRDGRQGAEADRLAWEACCQVFLCGNEFIYID